MNAEELSRLHMEYRQHVEAARNESASEEARKTAQALVIEARHALDEGLIEKAQDAEDDRRAAAVEARVNASRTVGDIVVPKSSLPLAEIRALGEKKTNQVTFTVPFGGTIIQPKAADWTTTDTTTYTSYTVPQTWANDVYMFMLDQSGVLAAGPTILNTADGRQMNWPKLTTDMTSNAGTEGTAATETNPVFGTVPLNSYRVDGWTPISEEVFRDSGVNVEQVLRELAVRSLAKKAAPYYGDEDIGTGSSLPAAITIGTTAGKTTAAVDSATMDEVKELYYSVMPGYRAVGSFVGNSDLTLEMALKKDGNGNYLWQPSNQAGEPDRLFGKPWFEDAYFDASGTGNKCLVFGDIKSAYIVRRIGGIEVSLSRDFAFTSFEITCRFALWHDAATMDTIAAKHLLFA